MFSCILSYIGVAFLFVILIINASFLSRSQDDCGPFYSTDPSSEDKETCESTGKKIDKELKPGPVKTDIDESISPYDISLSEFIYFYMKQSYTINIAFVI